MNIKYVHVNIKKVSHYGKPAVRITFTKSSGGKGVHKKIYVGGNDYVQKVLDFEFRNDSGELTDNLRITGDFFPSETFIKTTQTIADEAAEEQASQAGMETERR